MATDTAGWRITPSGELALTAGVTGIGRFLDSAVVFDDRSLIEALDGDGQANSLWRVEAEQATRSLVVGPWRVQDTVSSGADPGHFLWTRCWENHSDREVTARLCMEWETNGQAEFALIPAVSYNGNGWGRGREPAGLTLDGIPWSFASHRPSVPAGSYSENRAGSTFLFVEPSQSAPPGCSVSLVAGESGLRHRLVWPEEERPKSYAGRDFYYPGYHHALAVPSGEQLTASVHLVVLPPERPRVAWRHGLDLAWKQFSHVPQPWFSPERLWELAIRDAHESLWVNNGEFTGFSIGLTRSRAPKRDWIQRPFTRYEIGWCGQNAAFAVAMLQDALRNGDPRSRERGENTLNFWADHARLPNGLFWTLYDQKLENDLQPRLDTCNLGHGAYQFLVASELADQLGMSKPEWRRIGLDCCDFFVEHALVDGSFGSAWTAAGNCLKPDGTTGAFLLWPLLKAHRMTGSEKYLSAATRAFAAYNQCYLQPVACGGGALDTDCIDKESGFPLLMAALDLFELTGEGEYLERAEDAGYYLASWQWCYSSWVPPGTAMDQMGYDTCGGTSVSVGHHHQDPWGALLALGWLRLARATGRNHWRERARATWAQATIGISDGSMESYGVLRPAGSQDEGFLHTGWSFDRQASRGDTTRWLVAWPSAFRLITLMHWPDWEDLA